ncbi:MAG: radical SAM/SPASM domain-containing protein [Candidatus Anammoxibacter sp.]
MKKVLNILHALATRRLVITFDKVDFTYTHLSWKRLKNWLLTELSYSLKSRISWVYPTHLQVEPSNVCNLRCPLCHIVTDNKPRGLLNIANFKKLIDEVGDYLLFLHFWGWGEPFLNKDFFSMIRYAKNKGIKIITSTNGHFFDNDENVDNLIDSGLDVLIFALDGVDKETYEKYRQKGDFDKAMSGLRLILHRRKKRGKSLPRINLRMLVTRDNEDQISQMNSLAQEIGVDIMTLKTLCSFDNETKWESLVPCNKEYRRFEYDDEGQPIRIKNPCKKPWNHPTVYRDGTVVPCDYYTGEEFSLGNAFADDRQGFRSVWFGKEFQEFRDRFVQREYTGLRCGECSLNYANVDRCVSHAFAIPKT